MGFFDGIGGALLSPVINTVGSFFQARQQRKFAKEAWNMQNAYNTPAEQLKRYKMAGINPAYGGAMSTGNAAPLSAAATSSGAIETPNFQNAQMVHQQISNAKLENQRLAEIVKREHINNEFLDATLNGRIDLTKAKSSIAGSQSGFYSDLVSKGMNPMWLKYINDTATNELIRAKTKGVGISNRLAEQLFKQRSIMNPLVYQLDQSLLHGRAIQNALSTVNLDNAKMGVNNSDPILLRLISRGILGGEGPWTNQLLPYAAGYDAASWLGDIIKSSSIGLLKSFPKFGGGYNKPGFAR